MPGNAVTIEPLPGDEFAMSFRYDKGIVAWIRRLEHRRWNPAGARWEIHVSHLGAVAEYLGMDPRTIDRKLWRKYQIAAIRGQSARLIVGTVFTRLEGDGVPLRDIDEATSFHLPGYQFMPRFQSGRWDGKRHLLDKKKRTLPTGLVARAREIMGAAGVSFCEEEEPEPPGTPLATQRPALDLRDYQEECVAAALEGRRGVLEMATGAGKTAVATVLIHRLARPAMFFVHTRDLLHQTRRAMERDLGIPIGQVGDGVVDLRDVTVATIQTCAKALGIKIEKMPDDDEKMEQDRTDLRSCGERLLDAIASVPLVFFDECHHLPADCCYGLAMRTTSARHRFGLSATPYRADRQDLLLEAALGPKLYRANASALIERGFLVPPTVRFHAVPSFKVVTGRADYQEVFEHYIVRNPRRNGMIAEQARGLMRQGVTVLVLVSQVAHGEALRGHLPELDLVQGSDPAARRAEVFRELEEGRRPGAIATTLADEGLDIPSLGAVILASGGKSETRALQRVGRALRPAAGKREAVVVDFFDNAPWLKEHSMRRLEIFRGERAFRVETVGFKA
jgi:superfamily II DNA or RNA helicase